MKRTETLIISLVAFILAFCGTDIYAQETVVIPDGYELVDSVIYRPAAAVDTTLAGKDVFMLVQNINQTQTVADAMRKQVYSNSERTLSGYRIRIFFDNKQTARVESEETLKRFESLYHDLVAYRTYANPYFKVTVGDFRTRSEAVKHLEKIRHEFPSAFVVKENIEFPVVDKNNSYVTDTIKVLRPKVSDLQ